jgi:hypothetical protein
MIPHRGLLLAPYDRAVDPSRMEYISFALCAACAPDHLGSLVAGHNQGTNYFRADPESAGYVIRANIKCPADSRPRRSSLRGRSALG